MLIELNIKNFAIIDELKMSFAGGLSVITGETGAGKSIIIGALNLLLGDRASSDMIRTYEDAATVEALFDIEKNPELKKQLIQMGFDEESELLLKRIISRSGKNRTYLNGRPINTGMLSLISQALVNICGQHEHQNILNAKNHIDIIDEFGDLTSTRSEYADLYEQYISLNEKFRHLQSQKQSKDERQELLLFQLQEIEQANPQEGEDTYLIDEKKILSNVQKLMDLANKALYALYTKNGSILEELRTLTNNIIEIRKLDRGLNVYDENINAIYYQLEDTALTLRDYMAKLSFDPERIEAIDDRLELLKRLKRKYGRTLEDVIKRKFEIEQEIRAASSIDEEMEAISSRIEANRLKMSDKAQLLSQKRLEAAIAFKKAVEAEIHSLRMENAVFETVFKGIADNQNGCSFNPWGIDDIEFYLATNLGEELKPLNRIASGGELSRIILAMKKVLAGRGSVGTLIFDEVDSGIGGATAEDVGRKLKVVSMHHQVVCITHLPQIACFGDNHYRVAKSVSDDRTKSSVALLSNEERLEEIARMLGGAELTQKTKEHAREMLAASNRR